jgi:Ras-related protein Rab-18
MDSVPVLKVVIAGDGNVGKTSLVRQYCEGKFEISRVLTIGVDFQTKLVSLPNGTYKLSIWDMAGQERFQAVRINFYRGSLATALVYDLTAPHTLRNLVNWYYEVKKAVPVQRFLVAGNKADLAVETDDRVGREFARAIHAPYIRTSAASGEGVRELFEALVRTAIGS